jgi:hypothetical protein
MSPQADYVVANASGSAFRADLNNQLAAIVANNSGATEPATMYAFQWWADTTTGTLKLRNASNNAWVTIGTLASTNLGLLSLAGGTMTGALVAALGTSSVPGISFTGDLDTGLSAAAANTLVLSTNGTARLTASTTAVTSSLPIDVPLGSVGAPSLTFTGDLDTGLSAAAANTLVLSTNGTARLTASTTAVTSSLPIDVPLGSVGAPSLTFTGDLDTGILSPSANQLAIATNGVERVEFGTTEVVFNDGGVNYDFRVEGDTNPDLFKVDAGLDQVQVANLNGGPLAGMRNRIINGNFAIGQRGTTFASSANNDDAYTLDRWYILSDGNDAIDVTQETSVVPTNQKYAIALDVETTNKKFGIAQIIESDNCVGLTGGTVTLSFKAKVSAITKLDNVKAAIVAWSGTADTVTSDIISAWGAEGTNPTLIANATYENTPANLNVTTSYATYSVTASVDTASTTNIIVFIWSDVTDTTAGDFLYVTDVQLEPGPVATPFEQRPIGTELALCQRYFLSATTSSTLNVSGSTANVSYVGNFPVTMRANPTIASVVAASFTTTNNFTAFANTLGFSWAGNAAFTASIEL